MRMQRDFTIWQFTITITQSIRRLHIYIDKICCRRNQQRRLIVAARLWIVLIKTFFVCLLFISRTVCQLKMNLLKHVRYEIQPCCHFKSTLTDFLRVGDGNINIETVLGFFLLQLQSNTHKQTPRLIPQSPGYMHHWTDLNTQWLAAQKQLLPVPRRCSARLQGPEWRRRQHAARRREAAPPSGLGWPSLVPLGSHRTHHYLHCQNRIPIVSFAMGNDSVNQRTQKAANIPCNVRHHHFEWDMF